MKYTNVSHCSLFAKSKSCNANIVHISYNNFLQLSFFHPNLDLYMYLYSFCIKLFVFVKGQMTIRVISRTPRSHDVLFSCPSSILTLICICTDFTFVINDQMMIKPIFQGHPGPTRCSLVVSFSWHGSLVCNSISSRII